MERERGWGVCSTHCLLACCCSGALSTRATVALDGPFFVAWGLTSSHNGPPCPRTFGSAHGKVSPLLLAPGSYPTPRWFPCVCGQSFSHVQLSATPWTVARQAPLSMELPRREYWSWLPFLHPGDLPHPGIKPASLMSPALAGGFFTTSTMWEACWPP